MRLFLSISCAGLLVFGSTTIDAVPHDFSLQSRLARLGAWATTGLLFAGGMLGVENACEGATAYLTSLLPFVNRLSTSNFPRLVGGAISLPLAGYLYIKYHQLVWYLSYILYSGKQVSPIIAREVGQHLGSYVQCMEMIRQIHKELDTLIQSAQTCVTGSGKEQALKLIGLSIDAVFERELSDAQAYLNRVHRELADIKLDGVCKTYVARAGRMSYAIEIPQFRDFEHANFSKDDIEALDHLISDILNYWHTYLTSLATSIDQRVVLCQKIHMLENFVSGVLNRPLFPAFDQAPIPKPTPAPTPTPSPTPSPSKPDNPPSNQQSDTPLFPPSN